MTANTGEQRDWLLTAPLGVLMAAAADLRDQGHGRNVSYSRKVFIPLTKLCRDVCHYCTFAKAPSKVERPYLLPEQVLDIARRGQAAGCTEALFTLGDKPELRYRAAREALDALGHASTIGYLRAMCELVLKETSLLPHVNPGVMTREEIAALREVSVSQGIMLESTSERLCQPGGVHYGSPDKHPAARLRDAAAGRRAGGAVHHRHPDRHRRDARGAHRRAARHSRPAPPLRPHPGSDRAELPRQGRHQDGRRRGAGLRRPAVDGGRGAPAAGAEMPTCRRHPI